MDNILQVGTEETSIILTSRELTLIKWSLESMASSNLKNGNIRDEITSLRNKLAASSLLAGERWYKDASQAC